MNELHLLEVIGLVLTFLVAPMVAVIFRGVNARIKALEDGKVDKEVFARLETGMADHRKETREGLSKINENLTQVLLKLAGNNHD